jgi:hypothetical protein
MGIWSRFKKHPALEMDEPVEDTAIDETGAAERFCRSETLRFPVGDDWQLAYSTADRSAQIVPSHLTALLDHCQKFKTLDEHLDDYLDAFPAVEPELVYDQLSELVESGLLVSETALLKICREAPRTQEQPDSGITALGVITNDRIESLQQCLAGFIENTRQHGRANNFVVMDDTRSAQNRNETRQMLVALKSRYKVEILYGGMEEKRRFAEALTATGEIPAEVVEFALFDTEQCGCSIGANRNALMLDTVGEMVFSADDDSLCRIAASPEATQDELTLDESGRFMKFWFFPERDVALQSVPLVDEDVLKIHEQLLGRSLSNCVAAYADTSRLTFETVNARQLGSIKSGLGKVLLTFTGVIGDSGLPAPVHYLFMNEESRERLVQSSAAYRSALTSREILRIVDRTYISRHGWSAAGVFGFDNRSLLPPFMPVQRGEDDLFGFTFRACFSDGYFGFLPRAILHSPPERRHYSPDSMVEHTSSLRTYDIILACLTSFNVWHGMMDEEQRLQALGQHLMRLGSLAQEDFEEFVRMNLWRMQSDYISFAEAYLQAKAYSPAFWANDVVRQIETLRKAIPREDFIVPRDLLEQHGPAEARKLARRLVFKFGQLLDCWPRMVQTARSLRAQGRRLATTL